MRGPTGFFAQGPLRGWPLLRCWARTAAFLAVRLPTARRRRRPECTWPELCDFIAGFGGALFRPLQVRSEIVRAMEVVEAERPDTVVEIGTARGGSLFLLSRAAAPDAQLLSIDLPGGNFGGGYAAWRKWAYRTLMLPGQRLRLLRGDSHAPATVDRLRALLGGRPVDVLFIDGDHSYEGVRADYRSYSPLVRPGGLILLHDIVEHPPHIGCNVHALWREVRHLGESLEIVEDPRQGWAGIGVLRPSRPLRSQ